MLTQESKLPWRSSHRKTKKNKVIDVYNFLGKCSSRYEKFFECKVILIFMDKINCKRNIKMDSYNRSTQCHSILIINHYQS